MLFQFLSSFGILSYILDKHWIGIFFKYSYVTEEKLRKIMPHTTASNNQAMTRTTSVKLASGNAPHNMQKSKTPTLCMRPTHQHSHPLLHHHHRASYPTACRQTAATRIQNCPASGTSSSTSTAPKLHTSTPVRAGTFFSDERQGKWRGGSLAPITSNPSGCQKGQNYYRQ